MDILTPKGQETLKQEADAIDLFLEKYSSYDFVETPKDQPADVDGFIFKDGVLLSGVEIKCRMMTLSDLMGKYEGRWLITHDKIERGAAVCRSLGIDFRGFLYLVPEARLLVVKLWDHKSGKYCEMDVEETRTQATVNGGSIVRLNAYVDVRDARVVFRV